MSDSPTPDPAGTVQPGAPEPNTRETRVLLQDLTAGLVWPRLLAAAPLALRPERIGLAFVAVVAIGLIDQISRLWRAEQTILQLAADHTGFAFGPLVHGLASLDAPRAAETAVALAVSVVTLPAHLVREAPLSTFALGIPILLVWIIFGAAISRSTAAEISRGTVIPWTRALGFALAKWEAFIGAFIGPALVAFAFALLIAIGGLLFLSLPVVHLVGAVLYGLALLLGLGVVAILVAYILGGPMLIPGVACEGTDAFDAIQRAYAYVLGRPLRLVLYLILLILQGVVVIGLSALLAGAVVQFTAWAASQFAGEPAGLIAYQVTEEGAFPTADAARAIIGLWTAIPALLVAAFMVSYIHAASTALYLACRQINDGQDFSEIWPPEDRRSLAAAQLAQPGTEAKPDGAKPQETEPEQATDAAEKESNQG